MLSAIFNIFFCRIASSWKGTQKMVRNAHYNVKVTSMCNWFDSRYVTATLHLCQSVVQQERGAKSKTSVNSYNSTYNPYQQLCYHRHWVGLQFIRKATIWDFCSQNVSWSISYESKLHIQLHHTWKIGEQILQTEIGQALGLAVEDRMIYTITESIL